MPDCWGPRPRDSGGARDERFRFERLKVPDREGLDESGPTLSPLRVSAPPRDKFFFSPEPERQRRHPCFLLEKEKRLMSSSTAYAEASRETSEIATPITIAPIPTAFLNRVRLEGLDDLGQTVKRLEAEGGEPCRDVLRRARPGEKLILASFTPFTKPGPYHEYGPIFFLAEDTGEQVLRDMPPAAGSPHDYLQKQFVVRAYSEAEEIVDAALIEARDFDATIERFFRSGDVAFLHVRYPAYGCFSCRIDRG